MGNRKNMTFAVAAVTVESLNFCWNIGLLPVHVSPSKVLKPTKSM